VTIWFGWISAAQATIDRGSACCACEDISTSGTLFCALVSSQSEQSTAEQCTSKGGILVCKVFEPDVPCSFAGLNCPAAPVPALGAGPLGTLAAFLGVTGFVAVRRRSRRS
jgi:hypothetical protein